MLSRVKLPITATSGKLDKVNYCENLGDCIAVEPPLWNISN